MPRKNGRTTTSTTGGAGMASAQIGETRTRTVLTILSILASAQIGRCAESGIGHDFFCIGVSIRLDVNMGVEIWSHK